jgi:glycosyltransferase involved in cell wall biosynthesis
MVSIVIPSYNSEKTIEKCVESLLNQSYRGQYEVILVDSSNDATPKIVSARYPGVKLIHLKEKTDPGTARNMGIEKAKGEVIAFIDSDCMAGHDWLEEIDAAHRSDYNVVGGVVKNGNGKDDLVAWAGYIAEFREFLPGLPKREVIHIPTCNISYRKRVFEEFGLFQGEYYPQEDLVFNYNLRKHGERILLEPRIQIFHHHRSGLRDFLLHQDRIGHITSRVLRLIPLEGAFIARRPVLFSVLIPFLPLVKFARSVFTFLRYEPGTIMKRPLVLPIFALGLVFWIRGFARGVYGNKLS